jgi:hypothetical protein
MWRKKMATRQEMVRPRQSSLKVFLRVLPRQFAISDRLEKDNAVAEVATTVATFSENLLRVLPPLRADQYAM